MPRKDSVWMTCREKHNLKETLRWLRAASALKAPATWKPYAHVRGKLIATMDRAEAEEARWAVYCNLSQWNERKGLGAPDLPEDARETVARSQSLAPEIERLRKVRASGSLTLPAPMPAPAVDSDGTEIACMGCLWPDQLPHTCEGMARAA